MSYMRVFRIILGLVLLGIGLLSNNYWFYLGIVPLIAGMLDWCPMCKIKGNCKISEEGKKND